LPDHVFVQDPVDLLRLRQVLELEGGRSGELLVDDLVAEVDALVADVDARSGDQLLDLALRFAAEAAEELLVGFGGTCQRNYSLGLASPDRRASSLKLRRRPTAATRVSLRGSECESFQRFGSRHADLHPGFRAPLSEV
jgi:hypothetical protein